MTSKDFFYCYSKDLADYLKQQGFSIITIAKNIKSDTIFSMFMKSKALDSAINDYKQIYWTNK